MSDLTLEILKLLRADIARVDLRLADMTEDMHRIREDVGGLRGSAGVVRHDVDVLLGRWRDIEVRLQALEADKSI